MKKIFPYLKKIKKIYLIGEAKNLFEAELNKENYEDIEICDSLDEAFNNSLEFCKNSDIDNLLFSPACASFDMWDNFVARGENFRKLFYNAKTL